MADDQTFSTRPRLSRRSGVMALAVAGLLTVGAGAVGAGVAFNVSGHGDGGASLTCPGGISRLGHVLNEQASIFPGDPKTKIRIDATVAKNGYLVEKLTVGTHTGTHLDAPGHFIEDGRTVDELEGRELVWPVYVLDVTERMEDEAVFQLDAHDIDVALEGWDLSSDPDQRANNAILVLRTGFADKFATPAYDDPIPGFSAEAIDALFAAGFTAVGTDNFGPDASDDEEYLGTYTVLAHDGVVIPDLNFDDDLKTGDIMIASPVALENGSAFLVDPLACHASTP